MSLETAADARRLAGLSRAEYRALLGYLEKLPPDGWTEQSACADWKVYQAVSHIGSQPQIMQGVLESGLRGKPPMDDAGRRAIWDYFDNLQPLEVLSAFRKTNDDYFALVDSLSEADLGRSIPWIFGDTPVAAIFAGRLNEQALHAWDIKMARDRSARVTPAVVPELLEVNLTPARLGGLVKPERAAELSGKTIQFRLRDPSASAYLELRADGVRGGLGQASSADLTAELPAEGFVRLLWGRYDVAAGLASGELRLSDPGLAGALQAVFPGR